MIRYHIIFQGRVQGVGFRYLCQLTAANLSLTGYAKNLDNGMVEVQVQGDKLNIDKFISTILKGNFFIKVEDFSLKTKDIILEEKFFKAL